MKDYIKIYSHPRSGTHFLEAFLAENFYKGDDLSSNGPIHYGHWSNKILLEKGEPYQKLFGSHLFPKQNKPANKMIYIYRDGRAVIASLWNSKFYNKEWEGISFSEFLRKDIDWYGGPGQKSEPKMNIVQHWHAHTHSWLNYSSPNLLIIKYEDLKNYPERTYSLISKKFHPFLYYTRFLMNRKINPISKKVGLAPNAATIDSWKKLFSQEDLNFFYSQIPSRDYLFEE
jgi:bile-salt sulfotransferase